MGLRHPVPHLLRKMTIELTFVDCFLPGTHDCHVFMLRTEETLDNVITTYASVMDLEATILMAETVIARARKFEGSCWLDGFKHFEGEAAPATAGDCVVS